MLHDAAWRRYISLRSQLCDVHTIAGSRWRPPNCCVEIGFEAVLIVVQAGADGVCEGVGAAGV